MVRDRIKQGLVFRLLEWTTWDLVTRPLDKIRRGFVSRSQDRKERGFVSWCPDTINEVLPLDP
jgi:hypothetical protein